MSETSVSPNDGTCQPSPGRPTATRLKAERVQFRIEPGSCGTPGAWDLLEAALAGGLSSALPGSGGASELVGALARSAVAAGQPMTVEILGWECEIAAGPRAGEA